MTYAAKGEKVFALQDPSYPDCTPPKIKRSDHRLKAYPSNYDERAWSFSEELQYRALYELVSGSQTCLISGDSCHKYVPLEDLIRILMSEKDELIKRLEDELRRCCQGGVDTSGGDQGFGPNDKIAALTEELNNSREMLRKAMHKLQNIDEIVNENKTLQCRLRCSEERIKYLEEKRKCLESELEDLRSKSQIQLDLERTQEMLQEVSQRKKPCSRGGVDTVTSERDRLQEKVKELEKELEESKKKEAEIQMLRNGSKDGLDREEIAMENECYKKKLASMRCLEKQIQDLKKHGRALADKYKREAQKAADQMNKMCQAAKELQALREERDCLRNRVKELSCYEGQYTALQRKLKCVEEVIAENEILNSKMMALENLEKENEYLRCRLNRIQEMEDTAAEDKERITQLQCAIADQEEEMKELLCQIERLTSGTHQDELERLRCELYEKNSKLKLCEEQLAEIPMLEAEIDELRTKLQNCCREFPEKKMGRSSCQKIEVRLPAATTGICAKYKLQGQKSSSVIKRRCEERAGTARQQQDSCQDIMSKEQASSQSMPTDPCKGSDMMTCEEVQNLLQSSKGIISCVLEDMIEHQKEMEELEKRNKAMKEEIEMLKAKVEAEKGRASDEELRKALEEAKAEICRLKEAGGSSDEDMELLKELNSQMKAELQAACEGLKQVSLLEQKLEAEHKARCKAERQLKGGKIGKVESGVLSPDDPNYDCCTALQREVDDLNSQIAELKKLTDELKKENALLRELQKPCPDFSKELDEKCALENLLSLLQAELDAFKGQKLSNECEALRNELKRVMEQNCQLKALVDCYRQRLDLEKKSQALGGELLGDVSSVADRSKSPTVTPSGRVISSAEGSEKSKSPMVTPSGRVISSAEVSDRSKSPTVTPSGRVITSAEDSDRSKSPTVTPSGRVISSAEGSDRSKSPTVTPSGRVISSAEGSEKEKTPTTPPSGLAKLSAEEPERVETPVKVPSGRVVSTGGESEKSKTPVKIPSGGIKSSVEGSEGTKTPSPPKEPVRTPSPPKEPVRTPSPPKEPVRTPSPPKEPVKTPSPAKEPARIPSGRVAFAPEARVKDEEKPIAAVSKDDKAQEEKPAPAIPVTPPKEPGRAAASQTDVGKSDKAPEVGKSDKEKACEADLERLKQQLADTEGKLKAKEEEAKAARDEANAARQEANAAKQEADAAKQEANAAKEEAKAAKEDANAARGAQVGGGSDEKDKAADKAAEDEAAALRERLKQMEAENAEKLKALMDQHEKELANRDKAYNDNLNAMKAGYETDIRKLADRHKQSVIKLQGLHEDEVQELNTNYESQMEMMQTQSEAAISDVAKGSAVKLRKLTDEHARELKTKDKELEKLRDGLNKSQRELETLKKKMGSKIDVDSLQAKHSREMNAMKRGSQRKLSALKEVFEEEKRKSEAEVESLKQKLKAEVCDCKSRRKERKPRDPCAPLDFIDVIEKILDQGLDALTFNEIALVHRKACCALERIVMNSDVTPTLEPPVGDCCPHAPLLEADRQQLLRRIFALQNDIQEKQRRTQETIINMEVAIKKERCRLLELKNLLIDEQHKNSELKMVIQSQSQMQTNLKKERDELGNQASLHQSLFVEKSKQLDQEKESKKSLEEEVDRLKMQVKRLCFALEMSKGGADCQQNDQIEKLRMKLEQAQNQERKLAFQLENEAKCRMQLQCQVQALRQSFRQMVNLPAVEEQMRVPQNPLDAKSAKEMKNLDQIKEKKNKSKPSKRHKK